MPVGVNVRLNHDPFSYRTVDGISPAINFRLQTFDDNASQNQSRLFEISFGGVHDSGLHRGNRT